MAHIFECDVKFIHVRKRGDDANGERSGAFKEQVAAAFGEHEVTFAFLFDNDVEAGIKDAVETDRADMLVLVRHEYGFFESIFHSSVTQQIVNSAALPILVIRG
jgi:nucleotide-binding universal stress UspA family protein